MNDLLSKFFPISVEIGKKKKPFPKKRMQTIALNIENETKKNSNYRQVITTTPQMQLVLMSVRDQVPREIHHHLTQFIRVEAGQGLAILEMKDGEILRIELDPNIAVVVPPETYHTIVNTGKEDLKLYTLYSPPDHPHGLIEKVRPEID
jgi:mannose-6-phosphate isomerase-like protein (cupin superfamily)